MQVLCKTSNVSVDTRCSICGQGFMLYWERQTPQEQAEGLRDVEAVLRGHHRNGVAMSVHPDHGFLVPAWDGPIAFSGAAILGNAPNSAL